MARMSLAHPYPFDPSYGYTLETLLKVAPPATQPADFERFWRDTYAQAMGIDLRLEKRAIHSPRADVELYEVRYDSWDGFRIGAWLTVPKGQSVQCGVVEGHGYGGREAADFDQPGPAAVTIFPCARGFHLSADPRLPDNGAQHVVYGIESKETYIHRGCVVDYWLGASALLAMFPNVAGCLHYKGGSFGGGIGAMMLPWDARFTGAYLGVPSFGNHPLRLQVPCVGSGEAVRMYWQKRPEVTEVLRYFDSATSASFIRVPVLVVAALFDPAVCPQGQFSVYNALVCKKELCPRRAAHFEYPGQIADDLKIHRRVKEWFSGSF